MEPWYDRAFGTWYERLYPHRSQAEADRAMAGLLDVLPSGDILDVGCGTGRHLRALLEQDRQAVGVDRSVTLLARAAEDSALRRRVIRADMRRLPVASGSQSAVISMFTSFGYFAGRNEHIELLAEFRRVTRAKGTLVLDYFNAPRLRRDLVPESRRTVAGHQVHERRFLEARPSDQAVVKELTIHRGEVLVEQYREEVAVYERGDLETMLTDAGWHVRQGRGDYDGSAWTETSPRLILVAEAS